MMRRTHRRLIGLATVGLLALPLAPAANAAQQAKAPQSANSSETSSGQARTLTGTLPNGATWQAVVPGNWNGVLVIHAHGFRPGPANPAWDAGFAPTADALVARGYLVASSSYSQTGWALETAVRDQLDTVAAVESQVGQARQVIAFGRSMGGLVTSLMAEVPNSGLDGAVSTCGLVGGGVNLNNYQLDAAWAAARLLLPGEKLKLTGFTTATDADATINALTAALQQARTTPEGRARIALVAALLNTPSRLEGVAPEDLADAQAQLVIETLPTVISRRWTIVAAAGGDSGWTKGVDYARLIQESPQRKTVQKLYRTADLSLKKDLAALTRDADITPDPAALAWMQRTSSPTGKLQIPVLATHTTVDTLAPLEYQEEYLETVRQAGRRHLLRQAVVERTGHCNFTPAENVASIEAMRERIDTGRWGSLATTRSLTKRANSLNLGDSNFVTVRPGEFVNDRTWRTTRPRS